MIYDSMRSTPVPARWCALISGAKREWLDGRVPENHFRYSAVALGPDADTREFLMSHCLEHHAQMVVALKTFSPWHSQKPPVNFG
jgi:hypothetical protein